MKWFVYAGVLLVIGLILDIAVHRSTWGGSWVSEIVSGLSLAAIPVSALIAVTRYRLYDIDRIINRTVVYTALSATLALVYVAVVGAIRAAAGQFLGEEQVPVAISTLLVAALFQPARRRIQLAVDRRFNRQRYDAIRTLQKFNLHLREQTDLDALESSLLDAIGSTMHPRTAALWLRQPRQRLDVSR